MLPDVHDWDVNILGTDISDDAVARASRGWYTPHEIERGMPPARLHRYFQQEKDGWRVKDSLAGAVLVRATQPARSEFGPRQVRRHLLSQRGDLFYARRPTRLVPAAHARRSRPRAGCLSVARSRSAIWARSLCRNSTAARSATDRTSPLLHLHCLDGNWSGQRFQRLVAKEPEDWPFFRQPVASVAGDRR